MELRNNFCERSNEPFYEIHHIDLRQSLAKQRFGAFVLIDYLPSRIPSLFQNDYIYRSLSAGLRTHSGVGARLGFQFQKCVNIFCKQAAFTRFGVVSGDCIRTPQ